jgi:hypothetical protein
MSPEAKLQARLQNLCGPQILCIDSHFPSLNLLVVITLRIIYGYFMEKRVWVRVALVCTAVPIAVASLALRIVSIGLLLYYRGPSAVAQLADWPTSVLAPLLMLFVLHRAILGIVNIRRSKST